MVRVKIKDLDQVLWVLLEALEKFPLSCPSEKHLKKARQRKSKPMGKE